jgi:uncharacterized membrane protein
MLFAFGLIVLYAGIMVVKLSLWHANVLANDWVGYNKAFWNTNFHDLWLFDYDLYISFGYTTYLNEHFAPVLLVLAALYHVLPQPEAVLLMLHGAAPILAAIFINLTALHLIGDRRLAATLAFSYALSAGILWPTICMIYGFQQDGMLPPLAAAVGWALATQRLGVYFVALGLALGTKENVTAYGVILGICLFLFTKRRKQALITILISLIVFAVAWKGVTAVTGEQNENIDVAWTFIDDLLHLRPTFDYTSTEIIIALAYSVVFLPALFVWPFVAMIVPDLLLIGQVTHANTVTWHVMLPVTVLGSAAAFGTARILGTKTWYRRLDQRMPRLQQMKIYWTAVLAVSMATGPLTIAIAYDRYIALRSTVDQAAVAEALRLIPSQAGVLTTSDVEQYFTRRRIASSNLKAIRIAKADFSYLVVNRHSLTPGRLNGPLAKAAAEDHCLVDTAEGLIATEGNEVLIHDGILVVRFAPPLNLACPGATYGG